MAHVLNLKYGSTTIALASGDYRMEKYVPREPREGAEEVTETAVIQVTAASLAALQADIRAISLAVSMARLHREGKSFVPVFVQFQGDGESTLWQSLVYGGHVVMPETALGVDWANKVFEIAVIITRAPFWEGDTWIAVPLTNGNGTDLTTGIRVYNCNDGTGASPAKFHNYVDIDGVNDIVSELPAPVKMTLAPSALTGHRDIYIGHQADTTGFGLVSNFLEMEDTTYIGLPAVDADASGGDAVTSIVSVISGFLEERFEFSLDLSAFPGSYFRFFLCFLDDYAIATMEAYIEMGDAATPVYYTPVDTYVLPLGDLPLPPGRDRVPLVSTPGNLVEPFYLYLGGPLANNAKSDVLFYFPTDSWLQLSNRLIAFGSSSTQIVYTNDLVPQIYIEDPISGAFGPSPVETVKGAGIFLTAGVNNRVHFLATVSGGKWVKSNYLTVKMWYKPRRVTL